MPDVCACAHIFSCAYVKMRHGSQGTKNKVFLLNCFCSKSYVAVSTTTRVETIAKMLCILQSQLTER